MKFPFKNIGSSILDFLYKDHKVGAPFSVPLYVDISVLFAPLMLIFSVGLTGFAMGVIAYSFILMHEFAHVFMGKHLGFETDRINLSFFGGVAHVLDIENASSIKELMIAVAGPAFNTVSAILLYGVLTAAGSYLNPNILIHSVILDLITTAVGINLIMAISNMIPVLPLDGGRMLRASLHLFLKKDSATRAASVVGLITSVVFLLLSLIFFPRLIIFATIVLLLSVLYAGSVFKAKDLSDMRDAGVKN